MTTIHLESAFSNPNCDGSNCQSKQGQVRLLPYGGGGNLILCQACFHFEMVYRRQRNKELSKDCQFKIQEWKDLEVYLD